ncbi:AI-2E family transporter [Blautia obeum]|nr:AI-2E family transporter [Blautia obeum]RGG63959.1 AI-2E family transporter [Blautia sp. AF19-10LB]
MYILNQSQSIAAGIRVIFNILKPFLYGALIAYILAPMCNRMDDRFLKWCPNATEKQKKGMKFLSIAIAIICAVTLVVLLILLILPQVWDSTIKIIRILPARLAYCNRMIDQVLQDQPQLQAYFNHFSSQIESGLNDILSANSSMMQTIQGIIGNLTVQLIEVLSVFKNMFLGFLIAVYLLASRKLFGAQAKLLLYGIFPNKWAQIIEEEVHYTDKMFNGFFVGKIIDSAIIGVICFAGTTLLGFESAAFISVVIGVTNIIPFFGPFIGAIPCALLLLLDNPWQALYFLIFIVILQQVDGNIIGPKILGNTTGVSSFWVLFSILLFGGLWGLVGMVIAVPLFGVLYDIIRKLTNRGLQKNHKEDMREEYDNSFHKPEPLKEKSSEPKLSREKLLEAKVQLLKKKKQQKH